MIDTKPVLYHSVLVKSSHQESSRDLIRDLASFVDEKSIEVLDKVMQSNALEESPQDTLTIETLEIFGDFPLLQMPQEVEKKGFIPASLNSCLYFFASFRGRRSTDIVKYFFPDGRVILFPSPILIDGEWKYLVVGQDQCQNQDHKHLFSIRLLDSQKNFLHSLYRVLVVKK